MRTLLIDDHIVFTQGLKFLLSDLDESLEFLEATTCEKALSFRDAGDIDLVLLDFHLPGTQGLDALNSIKDAFDTAAIVMLSSEDDPQIIRDAIDNGASGFIPKSSTAKVLIAALRLILAGGTYLPPNAIQDVRDSQSTDSNADAKRSREPVDSLSDRQLEVLMKVVQGKVNKVVARELEISEGTVKAHLSAAFRALGVRNRTEAVFAAARLGLTPAETTKEY